MEGWLKGRQFRDRRHSSTLRPSQLEALEGKVYGAIVTNHVELGGIHVN
jgi:hypothetical protein